jgi:hypothetical protein
MSFLLPILDMIFVRQFSPCACFVACLESFLRDNGREFSHESFVTQNSELFDSSAEFPGAAKPEDFERIGVLCGVEVLRCFVPEDIQELDEPREGVFYLAYKDGNPNNFHCVRPLEELAEFTTVMDPLEESPRNYPRSWFKYTLKVRLLPDAYVNGSRT